MTFFQVLLIIAAIFFGVSVLATIIAAIFKHKK